MPQATDIVVNDGLATPVARTFALITPAGGDGSPALWQFKSGANSSVFPSIQLSARPNASKTGRKVDYTIKVPSAVVNSTTGTTTAGPAMVANVTVTVPNDFPEAGKNDAVAFISNVALHALIRQCIRDGVSAT